MKSGMPCNHLVLCRPLFLLPSVFPSIRVFCNELTLRIGWSKYWSFSISHSNEYSGFISFRIDWFDLFAVQRTLKSLLQHQKVWRHQSFRSQPSLWSTSHICKWLLGKPQLWSYFVGKVMSPPRWKMVTSVWAQAYGARLVGARWLMILIPGTPACHLTTNQIRGSLHPCYPSLEFFL